jgi:maleate isomerase
MGMSAETFWGGAAGNARFIEEVRAQAGGLGVSTGASACRAGLERLGCKRLAVLSPYQPVADANVTRFFEESGFTVVRFTGLRCPSATAIADVTEHDLVPVLRKLDGDDVDAIVQVGTNLSMVRLADAAERWLGKPVLAINAVTLWHALRANGIPDQFPGCGSLLREH